MKTPWRREHRPYADRAAAGRELATGLGEYADRDDVVVLGLPRGGVPVAAVVAERLHAPLDVRVVRKLGLPHHPELAMGAVAGGAEGLQVVRNAEVISHGRVPEDAFTQVLDREVAELRRREELYRGSRPPVVLRGRTVIVVDDGLATGASLRVALRVIREERPGEVVVAIPIGPVEGCAALAEEVDELVCPWLPADFTAVGQGYVDFTQTTNDEVRRLLSP